MVGNLKGAIASLHATPCLKFIRVIFFRLSYILILSIISLSTLSAATITSNAVTGNWSTKGSWVGNVVPTSTDDVIIVSGANITMQGSTTMNSLTINSGGTLTDNGSGTITITGHLTINGTFAGSAAWVLSGSTRNIDGSGVISNTSTLTITGDKTILSTASLVKGSGTVTLSASTTITNNGTITIGGVIAGTNGTTSIWTNSTNSTLNAGDVLLSTGILNASATGNTINYYSTGALTLKLPSTVSGYATYHNLQISGNNTKTLPNGNIAVNGDLTINSTLDANGTSKNLNLRGNWINNGNFVESGAGASGTITFDGIENQTMSGSLTEGFYNLAVNKSSGTLTSGVSITVANTLALTAGFVDVGSNKLTLGTSTSSAGTLTWGTGTIVGQFERYINSTSTGTAIQFPIGTSSDNRIAAITFSSITSGGSLIAKFNTSVPGNAGLYKLNGQPKLNDAGDILYNTFYDGYWSLTTANSFASSNFSLDLTGNGFTGFTITDNTRLLTRANSSSDWILDGSNATRSGNTVKRTAVTTLSGEFCFADDTNCTAPSTSAITGSTSLCSGATQAYSVTNTSPNTYAWTVTGGTPTSGTGNSITVTWSTGTTGTVSVTEKNACTYGTPVSASVSVNPIAPTSITGSTNVPENGSTPIAYSITTTSGYTYAWNITGGTPTTGTGSSISVSWGANGTGTVMVTATSTSPSCAGTSSTSQSINIYKVIKSKKTGNWNTGAVWDCTCVPASTDNVEVLSTHTVSLSGGAQSAKFVTVDAGGSLNTNSNALTISGDLTLNGTLSGTGTVTLSGSSTNIGGTGTISNTGSLAITGNQKILSTASINKSSGAVNISSGVVVTNNGTVTLGGDLVGASSTSTWINAANSTLNASGALLTTGDLEASATGNTVNYIGSVAQSITAPFNNQYYNLGLSGTGTATAPASLLISGTFSIDGPFAHNSGTITFNGSSSQTISGANASTTNFYSIAVNSGSTFVPPTPLNIQGDLKNDGTLTLGTGATVAFAPTSNTSQILGSSKITFYDITLANGSASTDLILENSGGADLTHILSVGSAIFDADGASGNRMFTLLSTADKPTVDASIATISAGGAVTGDVKVQRYMARSGASQYDYQVWRDISAPVNSTVWDIQTYLPVTGTFTNASSVTGATAGVGSLYSYKENTTTDENADNVIDLNDGWTAFPNGGDSQSTYFTAGQGYSIFIFGTDSELITSGSDLWALRGPLNGLTLNGSTYSMSPVDLPVTYTDRQTTTAYDNGWNLVGNPYPSAIDWSASTGWTKTNIDDAIYFDDYSTANPVFASYVNGVETNGGSRYIPTGQGFWVKANASSPVLTATENVKVNSQTPGFVSPTFFREAAKQDMVRVALTSSDQLSDEVVVYFSNSATPEFDSKYDAMKLKNQYWYLNLSSLSPNKDKYAINALPFSNCGVTTVPLDVSDVASGNYSLSFSDYGAMSPSMSIKLKDNFKNTTTDVRQNSSYSFSVDANNAATFGSNRFSLVFSYSGTTAPITLQGINACEPTLGKVVVKNSSLDFSYSLVSSADGSVLLPSINGTGSDLELEVPGSALITGTNQFVVNGVNRFCNSLVSSNITSLQYVATPPKAQVQSDKLCGTGPVTITASGAPADGSYHWYDVATGGTAYSNQSSTFVTESLTKNKTYYVSTVNSIGCEAPRSEAVAAVVNLIPATIIVSDINTIQSNYDLGNQWYLNGNPILGATNQTYTITESGDYQLVVTLQGCSVSADKAMIVTGLEKVSHGISLYPNPVKGNLTIEVFGTDEAGGEIYNALGITISTLKFRDEGEKQIATHDFASFSSGIYFVKVNQGSKVSMVRLIKD